MKTHTGTHDPSTAAAAQPVCPSLLTPAEVIHTYDDLRWEEFTLEYLGAENPAYAFIDPKGGVGDSVVSRIPFSPGPMARRLGVFCEEANSRVGRPNPFTHSDTSLPHTAGPNSGRIEVVGAGAAGRSGLIVALPGASLPCWGGRFAGSEDRWQQTQHPQLPPACTGAERVSSSSAGKSGISRNAAPSSRADASAGAQGFVTNSAPPHQAAPAPFVGMRLCSGSGRLAWQRAG
jgi:hypothetical protein